MKKTSFTIVHQEETEIIIGKNILQNVHKIIAGESYTGYFIICSPETDKLFAADLISSLKQADKPVEKAVMQSGEENKSLATVEKLLLTMLEQGFDRKSAVIALGGGLVGDIATLVSGLFYRGVDCVQIPTTLLAQVDSSYGGKGGVNMGIFKNMLGVVKQPRFVIVDTGLIKSLPENQILSGLGEAVKYGIAHDKEFFAYLASHTPKTISMEKVISTCSAIKMNMVTKDPFDTGDKRIALNFGHTLGHAIERLAKLPHGLAVSIGMTFAIKLSQEIKILPQKDADRALALLKRYGLPMSVQSIKKDDVLTIMKKDKKAVGGKLRLVLLSGIGKTVVKGDIDQKILEGVLSEVVV